MTMPWYEEAFMHYLGGIVASGVDRVFSKNSGRFAQQRIKDKLSEVESLQYIVQNHSNTAEEYPEFHKHVMGAKKYFEDRGISLDREDAGFENPGLWERTKQVFKNIGYYKNHERFNNRSLAGKLAAASGFELIGDCFVLLGQMTIGKGDIAVALGEDSYQIPSFYLGLLTGRGVLYVKDFFTVSKDERELDKIANELVSDGKILEIVKNYSPTAYMVIPQAQNIIDVVPEVVEKPKIGYEKVGEEIGGKLADAFTGTGKAITSGINAIRRKFKDRNDKAKAEEERKKKKLRDKYDKF